MSVIEDAIKRAAAERDGGQLQAAAATLDTVAHLDREHIMPLLSPLLDRLAVHELGLAFRHVPAGRFLMGSSEGDVDEAPAHEVRLPAFHVSETPLSWADFARILELPLPPALPKDEAEFGRLGPFIASQTDSKLARFYFFGDWKIRLQYCESETVRATDWHAHDFNGRWTSGGKEKTAQEVFGTPTRPGGGPIRYDDKPLVSVGWGLAAAVGQAISTPEIEYRLPTEAEWERASRGCFRGARYPWGDAPPDATRADFDRFDQLSIRRSKDLPPNDYGLYGMVGGVWEWCVDDYDACFYAQCPEDSPVCIRSGAPADRQHVLRGGSWCDCADALRVSFRCSRTDGCSPNIGFRLVRIARPVQS